jgi:DNA-binding transcriptional ArsR family regulator
MGEQSTAREREAVFSESPGAVRVIGGRLGPGLHVHISIWQYEHVSAYAALAEPHRRQILDLLRDGERPVGELVKHLDLSQPGVSKHLKVLREAGLVVARTDGKQRVYALRPEPLAEVDQWLEPYRMFWSGRLDALEQHLEDNP